ncbi:MAG: gliding motility lipoprotein GldJ [Flavobacteriales bacterium]|nr:gliding motility lipoprotein GldJ [Flavobacteriales bacterium]
MRKLVTKWFKLSVYLFIGALILSSCRKEISNTTGWTVNNPKNGGFEVVPFYEQETGPGLILVEGGRFTMGAVEQDVVHQWNNVPRTQSVSSFYMDETEIKNVDWREYVYWLIRIYGADYPQVWVNALPDTLAWRDELAFTKPYVELYYRHPAYSEYPVVGVTWLQATDYCVWRTDRVNEWILIREGILKTNPNQVNEDNFNLDTYLKGQYEGLVKDEMLDLNPNNEFRKVRIEDGILLPRYRLPTESEWEFAALGLIGNTIDERILDRRVYPWNGHWVRNKEDTWQGEMMANITRAKGDYMGVASRLNDAADITAPVKSYWPNDYGLYQMAGNVSEWVMDVYRPLTLEDANEFRSFRGNVYDTYAKDADGYYLEKDSLGKMVMRNVDIKNPEDELEKKRNYKKSQNIDFLDGEFSSSVYYNDEGMADPSKTNKLMYETKTHSLQSNHTRVYKGGNWKDRVYWMAPGSRRFLDEDQDQDNIGFRCAMHRVGKPTSWE